MLNPFTILRTSAQPNKNKSLTYLSSMLNSLDRLLHVVPPIPIDVVPPISKDF